MWYFILEFWRSNWGEQFSSGNFGYIYTYYTNLWYECGVSIPEAVMPGKAMIVDKNWQLNQSSTIKETYSANGSNIFKVHVFFFSIFVACFNSTPSCWYEFNFAHDDIWNGCTGGRKYVMRTRFTSVPLVGVILCTSTRWFYYSRVSEELTLPFFDVFVNSENLTLLLYYYLYNYAPCERVNLTINVEKSI